MKKSQILHFIMILATCLFLMAGTLVYAVETTECTTTFCGGGLREGLEKVKPEIKGKGISTADSIIVVILGLVEFALPFAGLFAFVGIIYGGFLYVTSFAEDQHEKAIQILIWSAMGLLMIFIAYPLVATLIKFRS